MFVASPLLGSTPSPFAGVPTTAPSAAALLAKHIGNMLARSAVPAVAWNCQGNPVGPEESWECVGANKNVEQVLKLTNSICRLKPDADGGSCSIGRLKAQGLRKMPQYKNELSQKILIWNHWPNGQWVVAVLSESSPNPPLYFILGGMRLPQSIFRYFSVTQPTF